MLASLVVIDVVGLTHDMLGPHTPNIQRLAQDGFARPMGAVLPAVTCTAQSTMLTGSLPREHGKETLEELFVTVAREPLTLEQV